MLQASPYYTTDAEAATVVYVYDYCVQSWQTAAAFSGIPSAKCDRNLQWQSDTSECLE